MATNDGIQITCGELLNNCVYRNMNVCCYQGYCALQRPLMASPSNYFLPPGHYRMVDGELFKITDKLPNILNDESCDHEWVSARNKVIESGLYCPKCKSVKGED